MILALTIAIVLLSGTPGALHLLGADPSGDPSPERLSFWKDIVNVILGALAGYITGRGANGT